MNLSKLFRQLFVFSASEKIMLNPICLDKTYDSSLFCQAIAPCSVFLPFFSKPYLENGAQLG
jgi:hypothetical protein